ncbi:hypothetical protein P154DRAFT_523506 [Amniculicola lignicola CBS 123094]|uniref:Apoptosis-inducing TAF9-like domain 1 family protein n=1 Tax=Amniculicola lignicola CBS 123094 TaxID=1392246 RepID=A0A6A5WCD2_9PLEO|nr:hypothetical protein P154DRAFT_523506 [Amniculicola lignicola CBS 123094]
MVLNESDPVDAETIERLKSALWYSIGQYVDEQCLQQNLNATPQFIGALTELVWTQISNSCLDLENFAKHAGRKVVKTDDVMLLARRSEPLENLLRDYLQKMQAKEGRPAEGAKKGKGRPAVAKGKGKTKQ